MKTFYQILELDEQASLAAIKQAYRRLVRLTHPDRTPDPAAHELYLRVNEAYDTLSQPERRARYDAQLRRQREPLAPAPPLTPFPGNAFQVLRVPYSATPAQIEQAYARLARMLRANTVDPALRRHLAEVEHAYATLRDPLMRQQHEQHARRQPKPQPPFAAEYARYGPIARRMCQVFAAFVLLLFIDMGWTLGFPEDRVESVVRHVSFSRRSRVSEAYYWITTTNAAFRSDWSYKVNDRLHLQRSAIFRQVRAFGPAGAGPGEMVDYSGLYGSLRFLPITLAIMAAVGARPRSTNKLAVDVATMSTMLVVIICYMLMRY